VVYLYVQELSRITEGVTEVRLTKKRGSGTNRHSLNSNVKYTHAVVEYDSHRSAAVARRCLIPDRIRLWGQEITVDWDIPESCRKVISSFPITKPQTILYEIQERIAYAQSFQIITLRPCLLKHRWPEFWTPLKTENMSRFALVYNIFILGQLGKETCISIITPNI
jgi:hypothetical protein